MTRQQTKRDVKKIPFWGRLEVRVIATLTLLGILCVGASAYLVQLAVAYFDERESVALADAEETLELIEPFHRDLVEATISAFQARGRALGFELALQDAREDAGKDEQRLQALLARDKDVVQLVLERPDGRSSVADRESEFPDSEFDWFDVSTELRGADGRVSGRLKVVFRIDPAIDARYQALGARKRELTYAKTSQADVEDAVVRVVGLASALVLMLSLSLGFLLARAITRKASELSSVMARVAHGDLNVRARTLGRDELGQLAEAFNGMLDELQRAQDRLAYLQRIGAWQEMARRIAHEIKNPLTPIQLAVQQLRDKDPGLSPAFSSMLRTSVEVVEDEIAALRRMVSSFSQFAKVPEVSLETIELGRVLEEFERAYGHLTEEETDVLEVRGPDAPVRIEGDRQLLKQALVNLVENAVLSAREHSDAPVRVEVTANVQDDSVLLHIDDNGPGIPESKRQSVFEPYETTREEGTGLGLAIVKKVVLDHGGEVYAQDSHLGGARFVLRLPRPESSGKTQG